MEWRHVVGCDDVHRPALEEEKWLQKGGEGNSTLRLVFSCIIPVLCEFSEKLNHMGRQKKKKSLLKSSPSGKNKKTRKVAAFTVQTRA